MRRKLRGYLWSYLQHVLHCRHGCQSSLYQCCTCLHALVVPQAAEQHLFGIQAYMCSAPQAAQVLACCRAGNSIAPSCCGIVQELAALQECLMLQSDADQHRFADWAAVHLGEAGEAAEHARKLHAEHQRKRQEEEEAM